MAKQLPKNPMQPIVNDDGRARFKSNKIVEKLLEVAEQNGVGLNELANMPFSQDDRVQLVQLIGYAIDGFHELRYVPDTAALAASKAARKAVNDDAGGCRDRGCSLHSGVAEETGEGADGHAV